MTETQTPECANCGDTGYIPPFMDECACGRAAWMHTSAAPPIDDGFDLPPEFAVGDRRYVDFDTVEVWTGTEWKPVETETLSAAEYYAKYPLEGDTVVPVLTDAEIEAAAEEAAEAAMYAEWADASMSVGDAMTELGVTSYTATEVMAEADAAFCAPMEPSYEMYSDLPIAAKPGRPMTAAQEALLARLIKERDVTNPVVAAAYKAYADPAALPLSSKHASRLIEALVAIPANPALKPVRSNKYDGTCHKCGGHVTALKGRIEQISGKWTTFHLDGQCLTLADKAAADADRVTEPGLYFHTEADGDKVIYRARHARSSKRLYAEKVIVGETDEHGHRHVDFIYNANAMSFLSKSNKMTWSEARAWGAMYGNCVACGRNLHDPRSVVQMYGSTCASHFGWPTVTLKQAEGIIAGVMTWEEVTGLLV